MAEEEENRRRSMAAGAAAEEDDDEDKESETETDGEELEPDESEPDDTKAPEAAGAHGGSGANPNPSAVSSMLSLDRIAVNQGGEGNGKVGGEGAAAEAASALSLSLGEGQVGKGSEREESTAAASRRLFQRLWTDEEEIRILRGFLEFTQRRGTTFASHQYDTGPFYEEIRQQLHLDFSKNQLIEKLRRLKKKYRNCAARMRTKGPAFSFRGPHEQAIYEIARHIWRPANKRQAQEELAEDAAVDLDHTVDPLSASSAPSEELNFSFSFSPVPPPSSAVHLVSPSLDGDVGKPQSRSSGRRARRRIQQDSFPPPPPPILPTVVTAGITAAIPVSMSPPIQHDAAVAAAAAAAAAIPAIPVTPTVVPVPSPISHSAMEETVRSCLSPLFKELVSSAIEGGASSSGLFGLGPMPSCPPGKSGDDKWRRQHILELEVYLHRIELVKEQVMQTIQELKGSSHT